MGLVYLPYMNGLDLWDFHVGKYTIHSHGSVMGKNCPSQNFDGIWAKFSIPFFGPRIIIISSLVGVILYSNFGE